MKTKIRKEDLAVMYGHAEAEYPDECCGVIIGDPEDPGANEVRPGKNIQAQLKEKYPDVYSRGADTGYFLDPRDLKAAFEEAAKRGLQVIGFYHSHPEHEAYWSEEDNRAAMWEGSDEPFYPDAVHVVISIFDGKAKGAAAFAWDNEEKRFTRHDL
ncbi:MAG: Mov34/MPN/PAD-1 family protein [Candidatus Nitrospinota bacterium M3_3B_026]